MYIFPAQLKSNSVHFPGSGMNLTVSSTTLERRVQKKGKIKAHDLLLDLFSVARPHHGVVFYPSACVDDWHFKIRSVFVSILIIFNLFD